VSDGKTLVYLLYGEGHAFHLELTYSVLTAVQQAGQEQKFRIVLITDEKNQRHDLPIDHFVFSADEFSQWTYGGRYGHAAKVNAFAAALDRFGGKVAMADTDTFFLHDPAEIFSRIDRETAVMHADEGTLADQTAGYFDQIIERSAADATIRLPLTHASRMFNSGVIGLHESARGLLDKAVVLTRQLNELDPRVHNVDQFAIAQVLLSEHRVRHCEDLVRHYFGYTRPFIHARINALFPTFTKEAFNREMRVQHQLEWYPPKAKIDLVRAKLKRLQRRQRSVYGFAYLAYLCAFRTASGADANAWSTVAIDAIRWNKFPREIVEADFKKLRVDPTEMPTWMAPEIRARWAEYWHARER
jgi:hypothetical protein